MAEIPKHARYATQVLFDSAVSAGSVPSGAVCFIEDTRQIWVDGVYYTLDDAEIEEKVSAVLGDYYTKDEVAKLIGDLDQEVKDVVSDVSGLKTEVAGKQDAFDVGYGLALEDKTLKVTLDPTLFVVVTSLPDEPDEGDENRIYLVPLETAEGDNAYAEYLWVNGKWELFGTLHTKVDLSDYLPLSGGTLTGKLTVNASTELDGYLTVYGDVTVTNQSGTVQVNTGTTNLNCDVNVTGATTLALTENSDAPSVVVADDDGKLYSMPVSALSGDGVTVTVVPMPEAATVTINGAKRTSVTVEAGTRVEWTVERAGYVTRGGSLTAERDVTVTVQLEWADGVFVAISDGTENHVVPWRDYSGLSSGESVEGVWVSDGRHGVLLALEQKNCSYWCASADSAVDYGGALTTSEREAFGGFTGETDAEMMRKNLSSSTLNDSTVAVGYCMTYGTSHVPVGEWRMMCGGEADMIAARVGEVNSAMSKCGGTLIADGNESSSSGTLVVASYYWLSDQYSASQVWEAHGMLSAPAVVAVSKRVDRTLGTFARAVSAFDF